MMWFCKILENKYVQINVTLSNTGPVLVPVPVPVPVLVLVPVPVPVLVPVPCFLSSLRWLRSPRVEQYWTRPRLWISILICQWRRSPTETRWSTETCTAYQKFRPSLEGPSDTRYIVPWSAHSVKKRLHGHLDNSTLSYWTLWTTSMMEFMFKLTLSSVFQLTCEAGTAKTF